MAPYLELNASLTSKLQSKHCLRHCSEYQFKVQHLSEEFENQSCLKLLEELFENGDAPIDSELCIQGG